MVALAMFFGVGLLIQKQSEHLRKTHNDMLPFVRGKAEGLKTRIRY
jgi:hypothetical protein